MKLEAVTVCVDYSDFLAFTIPLNRTYFDRYVIVTSESDTKTQLLCDYYNVTCVRTNAFYEAGATFNKAKGINEGIKRLSLDGAVLHLDADIYLPPLFRTIFEKLNLDKKSVYGFDRFNCKGFDKWIEFLSNPKLIYKNWCYQDNNIFPKVDRFMPYYDEGYIPIGFAQLWFPRESGISFYPQEHGYADRTDVLFAKQWEKGYRKFIPELIGIHLESNDAINGINWKGRKSSSFELKDNLNKPDVPKYIEDLNQRLF